MGDQHKMRASDRDRQQVVDLLRSALDDGRLTMDEYMRCSPSRLASRCSGAADRPSRARGR